MDRATLQDGFTLLHLALREDFGREGLSWLEADVTGGACLDPEATGEAWIEARQEGVVCGLTFVEAALREVSGALPLELEFPLSDGALVRSGEVLLRARGNLRALLAAERTALNFLQQLSGVATATRRLRALLPSGVTLLDTRKTLPGWRRLQKYAVRCGGGSNHRMGLFDMILIKENHIRGAGSITAAVERARRKAAATEPPLRVEVEVTSLDELGEAIAAGAHVVMLDNFTPERAAEAVRLAAGRVSLEVSGGISEANIARWSQVGVDWISSGALTHSAAAFDCSFLVKENRS